MRVLFYILLGLVIAVGAGSLIKQDSGQVVFALSEYSVQTSLSFFILMTIVIFLVFYFVLRSVAGVLNFPGQYRRWQINRGHKKSEYYLTQGYLALIEGKWSRAEKLLQKGAKYSRLPMINYIGAARAAQKQGAIGRRDSYLRQAYSDDPASEYVVGLTRAELQLNQDQTEQAYATLRHIDADRPGQNQVKLMLLEASSELKDWDETLSILETLEQKGSIPVEKIRARQLQGYAHKLTRASESGQLDDLNEVWRGIPKKLKQELYLLEVYIRSRLNYPNTFDCEVMLRRALKRHPDPALIRLYGRVQGENPARQLSFIEKLLKEHPSDFSAHLTAGRLYKRAELWGKARSSLEKSLQFNPSPEVYYELATLFEAQGDKENANTYYQKGLAFATSLELQPAMENTSNFIALPESRID